MKKIIAIFFFLTCSVFAQNKYQVFKNGDLVDTYIPVGSGSNSIERTYIRLQDSVLTIPYKILGDSIYARSGSLIIENVEFSNGTMTIARIITSSGITGGDTLLVDGFIETALLDTTDADSADVLTFNGTEWVASAPTGGGSTDTTHIVAFDKVTGLQDSLDEVQSKTTNPHQVYLFGNSITYSTTYSNKIGELLGSEWEVRNAGIGGNTTTQMLARLPYHITNNSDCEYVVVLGGINDIIADAYATTIQSNLQDIYTDASTAGITVVASTILPFKGSAAYWDSDRQAVLDSVNTWISGTAIDVDYVVDSYTALEDPARADYLLPAYSSADSLHPSTAGYELLATTIYNGVTWTGASVFEAIHLSGSDMRINQDVSTLGSPTFWGLTLSGDLNLANNAKIALGDNYNIFLGDGSDLQLYHNGVHSFFYNSTGRLYLGNTSANDLYFITDNTVRWEITETGLFYPYADSTYDIGAVSKRIKDIHVGGALYVDGQAELSGVSVADNDWLAVGDNDDFFMYHNGTNSYFYNTTGDLYFQQTANEDVFFMTNNTSRWSISKAGVFYPVTTTTYDIGSSGFRVDDIYTETLDASGNITAGGYKINTHTITGDSTISANDMYGGVFYVTSAATLTLPAVTSGMNITVITIGAIAVSVDPNASDKLWLDGTALDDGDKATNTSTAGDIAVVTYYSGDGWYVSSNSWTDGS